MKEKLCSDFEHYQKYGKIIVIIPTKKKISDLLHALGVLCSASVKAPKDTGT